MNSKLRVTLKDFPLTPIALVQHKGAPNQEYLTVKKLIAWRIENKISTENHQSYGIHYTDPTSTPSQDHRVDFCVSYQTEIKNNPYGVIKGQIPAGRCAVARHLGSREDISTAVVLFDWFKTSGETLRDYPLFFHYVNVGPNIKPSDMITDVYLPIV